MSEYDESLVVRFVTLTGKIAYVKECLVANTNEALELAKKYAEPYGFTNIKLIDDRDYTFRITGTTPGGRGGRNIAFIDG